MFKFKSKFQYINNHLKLKTFNLNSSRENIVYFRIIYSPKLMYKYKYCT